MKTYEEMAHDALERIHKNKEKKAKYKKIIRTAVFACNLIILTASCVLIWISHDNRAPKYPQEAQLIETTTTSEHGDIDNSIDYASVDEMLEDAPYELTYDTEKYSLYAYMAYPKSHVYTFTEIGGERQLTVTVSFKYYAENLEEAVKDSPMIGSILTVSTKSGDIPIAIKKTQSAKDKGYSMTYFPRDHFRVCISSPNSTKDEMIGYIDEFQIT